MITTMRALALASIALSVASASNVAQRDISRIMLSPPQQPKLQSRRLHERELCDGSCSSCFGEGYVTCPSSSTFCYEPENSRYGIDSCPTSTSTSASALPSGLSAAVAGSTNVDYCGSRGDTCLACFGSAYTECPGDSTSCYDPTDLSTACTASSNTPESGNTSAGSNSSGGVTRSSAPSSTSGVSPSSEESATATTMSSAPSSDTTSSAASSETTAPPETANPADSTAPNGAARSAAGGMGIVTVVVGMMALGCGYLVGL